MHHQSGLETQPNGLPNHFSIQFTNFVLIQPMHSWQGVDKGIIGYTNVTNYHNPVVIGY